MNNTITADKLLTMLQLQDTLNQKVHPNWRDQNFKWTRAIMVEAVEALDHYGWKWWKKQAPDMAQVKIELIDIWHFALSDYLEHDEDTAGMAGYLARSVSGGPPAYIAESDTRQTFELFIARAAMDEFSLNHFMALMKQCDLTWDELYVIYVSKNVLNTFRQDHGYKAGTYVKDWGGMEDNVALEQLMALKPNATPRELRENLESVYERVPTARV